MKKKKILTIMSIPLLLAGITSNIIQEDNKNNDNNNVLLKEPNSVKLANKTNIADAGISTASTLGDSSSNYKSSGYPSVYGYETHSTSIFMTGIGTVEVPSNYGVYHDCGIKIYGSNTSTSTGSTSVIRLNQTSPYIDFTDAHYMVPSSIQNQYYDSLKVSILTDFKIEIYKNGTRYFHAGAETTWSKSGTNAEVSKITYDKNGTYSYDTESKTLSTDNTSLVDFTKLGKIASSLSSGTYEVKVTYKYIWIKGNTTSGMSMAYMQTTATSTTSLVIDTTAPTITTVKSSDSSKITSGGYSTSAVKVTATDDNFKYLYYKKPNATSYTAYTTNTITSTSDAGWHYFYASDQNGNKSNEFNVYIDTVKPTGTIYVNGSKVESGSYTNKSFSYVAEDSNSGISKVYYKSPSSNSYVEYSSGSIIPSTSGDGWYEFYCLDKAGNKSNTSSIYLETATPTISIKRNGEVVYTYSNNSNETVDTNLYFNDKDKIEFQYVSSSGVCSTTLFDSNKEYEISESYYPNNEYTESITTALGITTNFKFNIVRNEPRIEINGTKYESGTSLRLNKDIELKTILDSIITSGTNTIEVTVDGATTTYNALETNTLSLTANDNEIKNYQIRIKDASGLISNFDITIDKEASSGTFISNGVIIENNGYTNKPFTFEFDKDATATISKDGGVLKNYNSEEISEDGTYTICLTDNAGNVSEFRITIDTIIPTGIIYVDNVESENNVVTSKSFYFTWDGNESCLVNGETYKKNTVIDAEGVYNFTLYDLAGNKSEYKVEIDRTAPIGNEEGLKNQNIAVSKWYEVIFDGNKDYFKTYQEALTKSSSLERDKEVEEFYLDDVSNFSETNMVASNDTVKVGKYYLYKSISNPNIKLYYFSEDLLNEAINHYAKDYITGPVYLDNDVSATGDNVSNPYGIYNNIEAPIGNNYVLDNYGSDSAIAINQETNEQIDLTYDVSLGKQLSSGLYKIIETDKAGNSCEYFVIIDFDKPTLNVNMETYSTSTYDLNLSEETLSKSKTYYLKSFEIKEILDSDPYAVVSITKDEITSYYTKDDVLPTLTDGGNYKIRVYDRLENSFEFNVIISSNEENISFSNNSDDTAVSIDISYIESNLTITSLEIYRNDELLNGVSPDKLSYTFEKDGTYKVILKDNFGRTIEQTYIFNKSLPQGYLNTNESRTCQDVSFTYDSTKYHLEVYKDKVKVDENNNGLYEIDATNSSSGDYEFVLINNTDLDNKKSYFVTIDTISPEVILGGVEENATTNGSVKVSWNEDDVSLAKYYLNNEYVGEFENESFFDKEGTYKVEVYDLLGNVTVKYFTIDKTVDYKVITHDGMVIRGDATISSDITISSNEDLKVTVLKDNELYPYEIGDTLNEEGNYVITVCDSFGNIQSFSITIDKSVNFEMNVADGGITNDSVVIKSNELVSVIVTKDGEAYSYTLGDEITDTGTYKVLLTDSYGNLKEVSFEIVSSQAKRTLNYSLGDNTTITKVTRNGVEVEYDSNHLAFTQDGEYEIFYSQNGREYSFKLTLDTTAPELIITGVEDGGKVDGVVVLSDMNEPGTYHVYKDNVEISYKLGDELSEYGDYEVVVTDTLGNTRTYTFTLAFKMNGWAIALISVGLISLVGITTFIVLKRKKIFKK